jgi:hypothetical protein
LAPPDTHRLYGVPFCPVTCCLLSLAHARRGVTLELWASLAMSFTQFENGVPFCPSTCCLLSPWQYLPYFLALELWL